MSVCVNSSGLYYKKGKLKVIRTSMQITITCIFLIEGIGERYLIRVKFVLKFKIIRQMLSLL